jgi:hypothetical protein
MSRWESATRDSAQHLEESVDELEREEERLGPQLELEVHLRPLPRPISPPPHTHTHTRPAPPGPHEQDSPSASEGPGRPVSRSAVCKHFFSKLQALLQQTASIPSANCKHFFSFSRSVSLEAPTAILRRRAGHAAHSGRLPSLCDRSHWNLRNPFLSQCEHQGRSVDTWRRSDAPEFCRWTRCSREHTNAITLSWLRSFSPDPLGGVMGREREEDGAARTSISQSLRMDRIRSLMSVCRCM